jgi:hypothetical protein
MASACENTVPGRAGPRLGPACQGYGRKAPTVKLMQLEIIVPIDGIVGDLNRMLKEPFQTSSR